MIKSIITARDLKQFYEEIRTQQERAQGQDYCSHHDMVKGVLSGGDVYKELGVHQGASLASAMLNGAKTVHLVDMTLDFYRENSKLFEDYAQKNGIKIVQHETGSDNPMTAGDCDVLMIDSLHHWRHTKKELAVHATKVKKAIVFHDTARCNGNPSTIGPGIHKWIEGKPWKVTAEVKTGVGAMMIERI
jgi:hypothetical protein